MNVVWLRLYNCIGILIISHFRIEYFVLEAEAAFEATACSNTINIPTSVTYISDFAFPGYHLTRILCFYFRMEDFHWITYSTFIQGVVF